MNSQTALDVMKLMHIRDGDILFVDQQAVDVAELSSVDWPEDSNDCLIVPVRVPHNKSVVDVVLAMSRWKLFKIFLGLYRG